MNKSEIIRIVSEYVENNAANYLSSSQALSPALVGMRIFDSPLIGVSRADDPEYTSLKQAHIIGPHLILPNEWLNNAQSVISIFLPFSRLIRSGNANYPFWPSYEWLNARIDGQMFINCLTSYLCAEIESFGYASMAPLLDARFLARTNSTFKKELPLNDENKVPIYSSNWSERHAAYISGLGTFSLSKNLITRKGTAGRFTSIITSLGLPADEREYDNYDQYCTQCGKCIMNCPVDAISVTQGKSNRICSAFVNLTEEKWHPYYGCGKCQVKVPCENQIPVRATPA